MWFHMSGLKQWTLTVCLSPHGNSEHFPHAARHLQTISAHESATSMPEVGARGGGFCLQSQSGLWGIETVWPSMRSETFYHQPDSICTIYESPWQHSMQNYYLIITLQYEGPTNSFPFLIIFKRFPQRSAPKEAIDKRRLCHYEATTLNKSNKWLIHSLIHFFHQRKFWGPKKEKQNY